MSGMQNGGDALSPRALKGDADAGLLQNSKQTGRALSARYLKQRFRSQIRDF